MRRKHGPVAHGRWDIDARVDRTTARTPCEHGAGVQLSQELFVAGCIHDRALDGLGDLL